MHVQLSIYTAVVDVCNKVLVSDNMSYKYNECGSLLPPEYIIPKPSAAIRSLYKLVVSLNVTTFVTILYSILYKPSLAIPYKLLSININL